MIITKPMKAPSEGIDDLAAVSYPAICSPKVDGIRCLKVDGVLKSSSFKPIPNRFINEVLTPLLPDNIDGELTVPGSFQDVTSGIMTRDGEPDFLFSAFDYVRTALSTPYVRRLADLAKITTHQRVAIVEHVAVHSVEQLLAFEKQCLEAGYEGVMVRAPNGPYKCGRSTTKQGWLLKLKRFKDSEARIVGFVEQMENTNEATKDELGRTKRSHHKAGKVGKGTLGKFVVVEVGNAPWKGEFRVSTGKGLTAKLRQEIWDNQGDWLGGIISYKYQDIGSMDAPRLPILLGRRDPRDM